MSKNALNIATRILDSNDGNENDMITIQIEKINSIYTCQENASVKIKWSEINVITKTNAFIY